jgi:hypothetical protein
MPVAPARNYLPSEGLLLIETLDSLRRVGLFLNTLTGRLIVINDGRVLLQDPLTFALQVVELASVQAQPNTPMITSTSTAESGISR